jgi:hypothetical protein
MSALRSNFLKLAFSTYQARTNLRDGFLSGSRLPCYLQEASIRKMGPRKGDGVFGYAKYSASHSCYGCDWLVGA